MRVSYLSAFLGASNLLEHPHTEQHSPMKVKLANGAYSHVRRAMRWLLRCSERGQRVAGGATQHHLPVFAASHSLVSNGFRNRGNQSLGCGEGRRKDAVFLFSTNCSLTFEPSLHGEQTVAAVALLSNPLENKHWGTASFCCD